jgi:copper chaperone CopZ
MEESQFFVPNILQEACSQHIEQYLRNLQGVFSVQVDTTKQVVHVRHTHRMKRRELSRTLNRIGYPEKTTV